MSQIEGVLTTTLVVTVALDTSCFIVVNFCCLISHLCLLNNLWFHFVNSFCTYTPHYLVSLPAPALPCSKFVSLCLALYFCHPWLRASIQASLLLDIYDVIEYHKYGHLRHWALAMSKQGPPIHMSEYFLWGGGSNQKKVSLRELRKKLKHLVVERRWTEGLLEDPL